MFLKAWHCSGCFKWGNKSQRQVPGHDPVIRFLLATLLRTNGLQRFFVKKIDATGATSFRDDRDINGGDTIPDSIRTAIQVSRELVVLLTPDSIERPWVLLEVGAAWGRRKDYRIVPVLCHVTFDAIPDIIEGKRAFHINDFDTYLVELKRRVKT
ncbi:MAG: toll/interleukin-1 receptor domain-containing protein [Planctomyces sp.]